MRIFNFEIKKIKKEKVLPPNVYAIVKINDVAKENGIYDDENKIIEINSYGEIKKTKYSESSVEALREQGIPVLDEDYSDEYEFVNAIEFGHLEKWTP